MFKALIEGWGLLARHKKAVVFYYLSNLLLASLLLFPFVDAFEGSLGDGDYREKMVERLDYDWFELLQDRAQGLASTFSPSVTGWGPFARNLETLLSGKWGSLPLEILGIGLLYLLANSFLTAATLASVAIDPGGNSIREFLRLGGEFWGRFFRLSLLSLTCFGLAYWILLGPLHSWTQTMSGGASVGRDAFLWSFSGLLLGGVILAAINLVFDYAKVITASSDRTSVILASLSALFFWFNHLLPAAGLYLALSLLGLLWIALMTTLEGVIPQAAGLGIVAALIVQQIYMVGRLALRFYFYTAQLEFYLAREGLYRPASIPEPPLPEPVPAALEE